MCIVRVDMSLHNRLICAIVFGPVVNFKHYISSIYLNFSESLCLITLQIDFVMFSPINSKDVLLGPKQLQCSLLNEMKLQKYVNILIFNCIHRETDYYIDICNKGS